MAVLVWKHGTTKAAALATIQAELAKSGHDGKVTWKDDEASASIGWGAILSVVGRITDDAVILEKCGGAAGGVVVDKCRELLERVFPVGERGNA